MYSKLIIILCMIIAAVSPAILRPENGIDSDSQKSKLSYTTTTTIKPVYLSISKDSDKEHDNLDSEPQESDGFQAITVVEPPVDFLDNRNGDQTQADYEAQESNIIASLTKSISPSFFNSLGSLDHGFNPVPYGSPVQTLPEYSAVPQPSVGIAINGQKLIRPKTQLLYLLESYFALLGNIILKVQSVFNNNYPLIISVINTIISKISALHTFLLYCISTVRNILEVGSNLFSSFSLALPSVTVDASAGNNVHPNSVYGSPQIN